MTIAGIIVVAGVISFLLVVCCVLAFCLRQQLLKVTRAEEICDRLVSSLEAIQSIITEANDTLEQSPNLKIAFSNDDETGVYFSELQHIQKQLNQFLSNEQETSSGEQS